MPKKSSPEIYGVLGFSLKHSLSPAMHNAAFKTLKIKARYEKFEVKPEELGIFLKTLASRRIRGLNVTIPYKEKVLQYVSRPHTAAVSAIGAVNTILVGKDRKLKGYNTDYLGFLKHLRELKLKPRRIAIIGAGGAAKAVCYALATAGAKEIYIYDIYRFKSISLTQRFQVDFRECIFQAVDTIEGLGIESKDLLVNASPVGMKSDDPRLINPEMLHQGIFVYDLIYNPVATRLLQLAKSKGLSCANGLNMLLYQGVESFNIWMKPKKAPIEIMRNVLSRALLRVHPAK